MTKEDENYFSAMQKVDGVMRDVVEETIGGTTDLQDLEEIADSTRWKEDHEPFSKS